ncbi:MAG TPA: NrfD/PsrC family molybdoenzyme membrane anchor subunit [Gemmatimonadaceae bacterium]|nr:NrfD/PsrC family molybdoenzyme membrane anchor subunit [Gemmatimonadaceae bacterium]
MQPNLPSTFFTEPPHFRWLIILYFFIGGISGGALLLAGLVRLFGRPEDRPFARLASYVALVGAAISAILLVIDLGVPVRFWHMVVQNHTGALMFKGWSPMSVGVWGLLFFSLFALLATLGSLAEDRPSPWHPARVLAEGPIGVIIAICGIITGLFLAGYTGVLLAVTNRPIWADSSWLGLVFLLSAMSTSVAALLLLGRRRRAESPSTIAWLLGFDRISLVLELLAIIVFLISLGGAIHALLNGWGVLLILGVIVLGILIPLLIHRGRALHNVVLPASLVLIGGFLLRVVVLLSSEGIHVVGTQVIR